MIWRIEHGDCLDVMAAMPEASVDAVVTDPPYGLKFMGKRWDHGVPGEPYWAEALRVAKPGAYLLAFGGTRTYHRLICAIEDARWKIRDGIIRWEIRDCIMWVYGSGFPKSHNGEWGGTALKPAWEPIIVARKPLDGTVAANWRKHGTGALKIDACRVPAEPLPPNRGSGGLPRRHADEQRGPGVVAQSSEFGRWPANLIHDGSEEVVALFPREAGAAAPVRGTEPSTPVKNTYGTYKRGGGAFHSDSGSAARFFYCAKASKQDRGEGNNHPTVKPTALMRYLCRLVSPPGGTVLDPFCGSGSTGKAAVMEGFSFIGIDNDPTSIEIALARVREAAGPLFSQ